MAPARVLGRHFPDPDTVFATSPHPAMAGSDQVRVRSKASVGFWRTSHANPLGNMLRISAKRGG